MGHETKEIFGTIDYVVLVLMLSISAFIGIWYAIADRKKSTTQEFLMGGRSLSVLPVAMSVLASYISAITLLGTPVEIYRFGTQYFMINVAFCLVCPATAYLYLPVFYHLGVTSAYEYLELRFHKNVRLIGSVVFSLHMLMILPIVLYAPALALSQVTGIQLWTAVLSIGLVCTFYTSIGGIKAVVWTDFFQSFLMYSSILVIVIKGAYDVGGFDVVWKAALEGDRIEFFRMDVDPYVRHTFWSLAIGGYFTWMGNYAANQAMIQRYLTIGSLKGAQRVLWINMPALVILVTMTSMLGLVIYAYYAACDPIATRQIDTPDQLFPHFVMETLSSLPGIPGLFVSGIFSGALSTISSGLNSLSAVFLEDFIKPSTNLSEVWATRVTKFLAVVFGSLAILLVFVAQKMGGVLQAALTVHGIVGGPMLGIFTLGMFFPPANTWGASIGLISGFVIAFWFGMGSSFSQPYHPESPLSYENCSELYFNVTNIDIFNMTRLPELIPNNDHILPPYRLSYLWLSAIGFFVVIIVGLVISYLTGETKNVEERLLSPIVPWIYQFLPGGRFKKMTLHPSKKGTSMATLSLSVTSIASEGDFSKSKKEALPHNGI